MTKHVYHENCHDLFEYHGCTTIEFIRERFGKTIRRDWLLFDTIEDATDYFNLKGSDDSLEHTC